MNNATRAILLAGLSTFAFAAPASAQDQPAAEPQAQGQANSQLNTPPNAPPASQDEIVVTGTRRAGRTATDSASPIDVIGAEELQSQPAANMLDIVKNVVPSFFVPQNAISDASTFVRPPSLRGLGADQVLVMINGKRYNRAALVQV